VNLRSGPGTDQPVLCVLEPGTPVTIAGASGDWLEVAAKGQAGFVNVQFVAQEQHAVPEGLIDGTGPFGDIALAPPDEKQIKLAPGASSVDRTVAVTWNRSGNLLGALADHLKFDAGCAVAVFGTESSGSGFAADGRMVIRFENHHFHQYWGQSHQPDFDGHFQFDGVKPWTAHQWRASENDAFQPVHRSQSSEWSCFQCACGFDEHAAKLSISMGGPQILGSNYGEAGFESVEQMYDAFASGERRQIVAFFDFLQGPATHPPKVLALQQRDFIRFAQLYNGPGNAAEYGARIAGCFDAFQRLRPV
jgi:hypothetical protein